MARSRAGVIHRLVVVVIMLVGCLTLAMIGYQMSTQPVPVPHRFGEAVEEDTMAGDQALQAAREASFRQAALASLSPAEPVAQAPVQPALPVRPRAVVASRPEMALPLEPVDRAPVQPVAPWPATLPASTTSQFWWEDDVVSGGGDNDHEEEEKEEEGSLRLERAALSGALEAWLAARGLGFLGESLAGLGALELDDLGRLDVRDRRRLWLEVSLESAARGLPYPGLIEQWEALALPPPPHRPPIPAEPPKPRAWVPRVARVASGAPSRLVDRRAHAERLGPEGYSRRRAKASAATLGAVMPAVKFAAKKGGAALPHEAAVELAGRGASESPELGCSPLGRPGAASAAAGRRPLRYDEIAIVINSTPHGNRYFGENFQRDYYAHRASAGLATWGRAFPHVWVVMDDSAQARALVARSQCTRQAFSAAPGGGGGSVEHTCEGKPIILAPCDDGYWGETGPCCKCQFAFRHVFAIRHDVASKFRWFAFADDDTFFVPSTMRAFLDGYDGDNSLPPEGGARGGMGAENGRETECTHASTSGI